MATAIQAIDLAVPIVQSLPNHVARKGDRDMVSDIDLAVQGTTARFLAERTPDIALVAEEDARSRTADARPDVFWTLDPVDGTANYVRNIPTCGISLALVRHDRPVLGVIDLPFLGTRYQAMEDQGALANGRPIQVAHTERMEDAIVTLGDYAVGEGSAKRNLLQFGVAERLASVAQRVRMIGSAAADLCWLADGRTDISVTLSNLSWDVAAGVIIAREAGAVVMDIDGTDHSAASGATLATNPNLRQPLLGLIDAARQTAQAF